MVHCDISCWLGCFDWEFHMHHYLEKIYRETEFHSKVYQAFQSSWYPHPYWPLVMIHFSFLLCFTCTFHYFFTPVWSLFELHLPIYIWLSFTFFEAVHLTQSSCSTMMTPSLFLTLSDSLLCINTWEIVSSTLTHSWEYTLSLIHFTLKPYQLA